MRTGDTSSGGGILHVTTVHPWNDIRIFVKECRALAKAGFDVALAAPAAPAAPRDGVRFVRLPGFDSRRDRVLRGLRQVWRTVRAERPALVHLHDPELFVLVPLLRLTGTRVVVDLHEFLPTQVRMKLWIPGPLRPLVALLARLLLWVATRMAHAVVAVTPEIAAFAPSRKTILLRNYPLLEEFPLRATEAGASADPAPEVVYVGGITRARGAETMIEAMGRLQHPSARLVVAGRWESDALRAELARLPGWSRVEEAGWLDRDGIADLLARSRIGVFVCEDNPHLATSLPIKLFEYMAAGLPVVVSEFPVWRDIVEGAGCGLLVGFQDPQSLADALDQLLADPAEARAMGAAGREAVQARYNWEAEQVRLLELTGVLVSGSGRR